MDPEPDPLDAARQAVDVARQVVAESLHQLERDTQAARASLADVRAGEALLRDGLAEAEAARPRLPAWVVESRRRALARQTAFRIEAEAAVADLEACADRLWADVARLVGPPSPSAA